MTIKIVLNRLTVIWPFQPSNLVLYKINLRQQHVFYKIVKLDSKLLIKLDTIPLTYFILLTWTCPPEFETYYQIKDITHTSCSDGNLCPPLWYTSVTQRDEERKKKKLQKLLRSMICQKIYYSLLGKQLRSHVASLNTTVHSRF